LHNYCYIDCVGNPPSDESPVGPYPTVVSQTGGKKCLVVQDYAFGKYLGYLNVTFDGNGDVTSWGGNPILLDASVQPGTLLTVCNLASLWNFVLLVPNVRFFVYITLLSYLNVMLIQYCYH